MRAGTPGERMTMIVSKEVKEAMLAGLYAPVHAEAEPGKALISFDTFRVEQTENGMAVMLLMKGQAVACWNVHKIDFDTGETLTLSGFIGNTQVAIECH